jgi:hypothetical protein
MATIKFFIQSKNNPAGIYVRLKEGRQIDAKAKTKYAIDPDDWSSVKGQPKNLKQATFKQLHENLKNLGIELLSHYNNSADKDSINTLWLKDFIKPTATKEETPNKLISYFDYYIKKEENKIKPGTISKIKVNKSLVERFQKSIKKEILIKDINPDLQLEFERYCEKDGYSKNTISRCVKYIKTMGIHARNNRVETHYQLDSIKVKFEEIEKIFLTPHEIDTLQQHVFEHDYLNNARDWLIISCETGQRISDFLRFTNDHIRYEGDFPLLEFTQKKGGRIMAIPFTPTLDNFLKNREWKFPRKISEVNYNKYIKEACKIAGLSTVIKGSKMNKETKRKQNGMFSKHELVTSHIGRRSFASNYYGIYPTPLLMNVTGHTTEKSFLKYIGKSPTDLALQLAQYYKSKA